MLRLLDGVKDRAGGTFWGIRRLWYRRDAQDDAERDVRPDVDSTDYEIPFPRYDPDRFSAPWVAIVTRWEITERPLLRWGHCLQGAPGEPARLSIRSHPGNIIRWGIKDYHYGTRNQWWGLTGPNGRIARLTAADARDAWRAREAGRL